HVKKVKKKNIRLLFREIALSNNSSAQDFSPPSFSLLRGYKFHVSSESPHVQSSKHLSFRTNRCCCTPRAENYFLGSGAATLPRPVGPRRRSGRPHPNDDDWRELLTRTRRCCLGHASPAARST
ncbi:unnamed protein product, partial [Musa acuminata subsp. burmannicoides]